MIYKLNKKKLHLFLGYCILKIILIQIFLSRHYVYISFRPLLNLWWLNGLEICAKEVLLEHALDWESSVTD